MKVSQKLDGWFECYECSVKFSHFRGAIGCVGFGISEVFLANIGFSDIFKDSIGFSETSFQLSTVGAMVSTSYPGLSLH